MIDARAERRTNTEHNGARAVDSNSNAKAATKPPPTGGVNLSIISVGTTLVVSQ